ncbi:GNAT family N-acetyltransferase [Methylobacterium sp. J-077]|uniref:GNAT family N-acetyltransferase n=1 Tax=Methylobacterium sp. J-077 TaxID=2836656 RepID=UPI001FB9D909|nr:GNAT family N-acetyltransferase [Methylobacterium sp. J-077]MCJ2124324.1 acetyltransferase [Methylobacterium sp. J-077]
MTLRARADSFVGIPLDGWTGTSRHWPVAGESLTVESLPRDAHTARLRAMRNAATVAEAELRRPAGADTAILDILHPDGRHPGETAIVAALVEAAFQRCPDVPRLRVAGLGGAPALLALESFPIAPQSGTTPGLCCDALSCAEPASTSAESARAGESHSEAGAAPDALIERAQFYQLPLLWLSPGTRAAYPLIRSRVGPQDRLPPLRPPQPNGMLYRRWLPHLGTTLSFRSIDRRRDLALFHGWMNQPRVSYYWELAQGAAELDGYLADQEADPHLFGVIGSFDDVPVGYFEFYWAKEDRLGPHYDAEDFDRGWHGLIGNAAHLGRPKTLAWFKAVTHYLFLDEPRTRRIMGEPRASHRKMLSYCADAAYETLKEFDFPHKRAALVCCERERFFRAVPL